LSLARCTATPKHNNGAIFFQDISDYPLDEAISQNVLKHPVLPDAASLQNYRNAKVPNLPKKYADYMIWCN
jgi:type III restriction enzyme